MVATRCQRAPYWLGLVYKNQRKQMFNLALRNGVFRQISAGSQISAAVLGIQIKISVTLWKVPPL